MTSCNGMEEQVFEYVDGLLSGESRKQVNQHLENCEECKRLLDNTKQLKEQLRNLKSLSTSPDFDMVLRTRIKMEKSLNRSLFTRPVRVPMYVAAVAVILIAVFAGINFNRGVSTGQQNPNVSAVRPTSTIQGFVEENQSGSQDESVVFPVDVMPVGGTSLRSDPRQRAGSLPDSMRSGRELNRIQTVEF